MSDDNEISRLVKDPGLLVELCRQVIDQLDSTAEDADFSETEAQLREISRTVERLEKVGVSVPEALRGEKTRLAAALGSSAETMQALSQLADEFDEISRDLKKRIGRGEPLAGQKRPRSRKPRSLKTDRSVLREHIVQALKKLGGRAHVDDVLDEIGKQLDGKLLPGDLEWVESVNKYSWQNNVHWERYQMTQDGTLSTSSPRGFWELSEDHR